MGSWGPGIFSNDGASDARDAWRAGLLRGEDPDALTEQITASVGADVETWTGLAAAQYETGRLAPAVRDRALELIDAGGDLELWEGDKRRARALAGLEEKLRGPQPAPKQLRGPRKAPDPGVRVGDVLRIADKGDRLGGLFHVAALLANDRGGQDPVVLRLAWVPDGPVPSRDEIVSLPYMSAVDLTSFSGPEPPEHQSCSHLDLLQILVDRLGTEFGPHVGEIVARDTPPRPIPQFGEDGVGDYTRWGGLTLRYEFFAPMMAMTRRRLSRFGPNPLAWRRAREFGVPQPRPAWVLQELRSRRRRPSDAEQARLFARWDFEDEMHHLAYDAQTTLGDRFAGCWEKDSVWTIAGAVPAGEIASHLGEATASHAHVRVIAVQHSLADLERVEAALWRAAGGPSAGLLETRLDPAANVIEAYVRTSGDAKRLSTAMRSDAPIRWVSTGAK